MLDSDSLRELRINIEFDAVDSRIYVSPQVYPAVIKRTVVTTRKETGTNLSTADWNLKPVIKFIESFSNPEVAMAHTPSALFVQPSRFRF